MKNYKLLITLLIASLVFTQCGDSKKEEDLNALEEQYKCKGVDDCLSKYEFEGARAYAPVESFGSFSFDDAMKKIVNAESKYWVKEKDYKTAIGIVDEYDGGSYSQHEKIAMRYELLSVIIDELIEARDFDQAKIYALKASDEHTLEGWNATQTNDFDKEETQQKLLLKKIDNAKKILSK